MIKLVLCVMLFLTVFVGPVSATLQSDLESQFDIVETFDQLRDWSPTLTEGVRGTFLNQLPVKANGDPSIWDFWDFWPLTGTSGTTFIGNNDGNTFNGSSKSLVLNINNDTYPARLGVFFGSGTADTIDPYSAAGIVESGYRSDIHIFWMTKHSQQNFIGWPWPYDYQQNCHKIGSAGMGYIAPHDAVEGSDSYGAANAHFSIWGSSLRDYHLYYATQWFSDAEWSEVVAQDLSGVRTLNATEYMDQLYIEGSEWYGTELHIHLGAPGVADGYQEMWTYDSKGNATYQGRSGYYVTRNSDKNWGINSVFFGGNQCGLTTDTATYYIDDIIIDGDRIGPTYFALLASQGEVANPVVEILTSSGQTTTASIFTITGTATSDTGQTISGVTCSGQTVTPDDGTWDEQIESFTCLANLALGENTLVFIGSDGTRSGSDSVTITRTIPGEYTTRGAGFSIKGCTLK